MIQILRLAEIVDDAQHCLTGRHVGLDSPQIACRPVDFLRDRLGAFRLFEGARFLAAPRPHRRHCQVKHVASIFGLPGGEF